MRFTTDGLIIREKNAGENDKLVVTLTRDRGIVTAFASGAKNMKNKNSSATALLAFSNITFYEGRSTYRINEAVPIDIFFEIRLDIERLALAQYFCELLLNFAPQEEEANGFLRLALAALHYIRKNSRPLDIIKPAFELRLLSLAGYMPDLRACHSCGEDESRPVYLDRKYGNIYCGECNNDPARIRLSAGVLSAMRYITSVPVEKLFSFLLPEGELADLKNATESMIFALSEKQFKTLEFYKSL